MSKRKGLNKETKVLYSSLIRSLFLCFVALFAIVTATVAWFVNNTSVNSGTAQVSAEFEPIKLAVSEGDARQNAEKEKLNLSDGATLKDKEGNVIVDAKGNPYYYTNAGTIALRLDKSNYEVSPGVEGKVTFYVVSNGGASDITLQIGLGGYGEDENDNSVVKQIDDKVLNSLINGHILLFDDYSDETGYSNWLFETNNNSEGIYHNSITVDLSRSSAGDIVPVDFYWIWPTRYQNYVNDFKDSDTRQKILEFANDQASNLQEIGNGSGYVYSYIFFSNKVLSSDTNRSKAYDLADEYIGGNAQYLYLTIQTSVEEEAGGVSE